MLQRVQVSQKFTNTAGFLFTGNPCLKVPVTRAQERVINTMAAGNNYSSFSLSSLAIVFNPTCPLQLRRTELNFLRVIMNEWLHKDI